MEAPPLSYLDFAPARLPYIYLIALPFSVFEAPGDQASENRVHEQSQGVTFLSPNFLSLLVENLCTVPIQPVLYGDLVQLVKILW
jgi:hypothetical protein